MGVDTGQDCFESGSMEEDEIVCRLCAVGDRRDPAGQVRYRGPFAPPKQDTRRRLQNESRQVRASLSALGPRHALGISETQSKPRTHAVVLYTCGLTPVQTAIQTKRSIIRHRAITVYKCSSLKTAQPPIIPCRYCGSWDWISKDATQALVESAHFGGISVGPSSCSSGTLPISVCW